MLTFFHNYVFQGILARLDAGEVVIGDGGFVFALEKRGYVKAGPWTPEATLEHPEAVRQLHREFLRSGSDVMQTFTFYASDDKLENRGNYVAQKFSGQKVNEAACDIAREVADEGDALVAGGAQIVGINCHFDPMTCLETMKLMKAGLEAAKLKAHLMVQPLAYHTPDCNHQGFIDLPEFPFGKRP
ncbi:Betaine--homocysteine S-methyltransferase 1 [Acipenser ruthenus]|uniref:Betaine--homocysteine S-methyltransferase 1 n=1 Tax=Acipenser ruthenus TaxID=7906 RepID=A0A444US80_ACIRT|nr:Betaine--homocysteine S-methyltransferase 1 [Acipenser ruthenus]